MNPPCPTARGRRRHFSASLFSDIGLFSLALGLVLTLAAVTVFA